MTETHNSNNANQLMDKMKHFPWIFYNTHVVSPSQSSHPSTKMADMLNTIYKRFKSSIKVHQLATNTTRTEHDE